MNFKNVLIIAGQLISISIFSLLGSFLVYMKIPGNGALCDAEEILLLFTWLIFISIGIGLLINSIIYYDKGKWKKYRLGIIGMTIAFFFISKTFRELFIPIYYGKEKFVIESNDIIYVKITLFKDGKFFAYTYDTSCESEKVGIYSLDDDILELKFDNDNSRYLGTKYRIDIDSVECLNCISKIELKIK